MSSNVRVFAWRDVLVVCDDGRSVPKDYDELLAIALELAESHPAGIGLLSIIPESAVPPSDDVRAAMNSALERVSKSLRGAVWYIEGAGFQAAMVRAVLLGLRFLRASPYPRHTSGTLEEALTWLLPLLHGNAARLHDVNTAAGYIRERRAAAAAVASIAAR
ncbi:MAG: hypothetical protein RLZZ450_5713 [Pseudomonadota bacterium]|jgi:hypothetical protein